MQRYWSLKIVYEGPYGFGSSLGANPDDPGLQIGMVLSNEPGYYKDGDFGKIWKLEVWFVCILI